MARIIFTRSLLLFPLLATIGLANAQTCSGTQDFSGPYVFTAVRLAYVPQSTTPPGTTQAGLIYLPQADAAPGTTGQYSLTPIGRLVGWASNTSPFSGAGRVLADGAGVLFASKVDDPQFVRVGTYTVSGDCAIAITLNDGFLSAANARSPVSFQGVLTDRGAEANLVQSSQGSGALLNFVRPILAAGCSVMSVSGRYGLSGLGVNLKGGSSASAGQLAQLASPSPLTFALQFNADGAGSIGSTNGAAGYTGSYTVNSDCTGSLTLISPDQSTTRKFAFVLANSNNNPNQLPRASMLVAFDDPGNLAGFGEAR